MISPDRVVILIPTYNEAGNIALTLKQIHDVDPRFHVVVLDDNSPDGTGEVVKKTKQMYPNVSLVERWKNKGFAQSYLDGFARVSADGHYDVLVTMDADFSHEPGELPALLALFDRGADMVIGSRYARRQSFPHISWWRRVMSHLANIYVGFLLGLPVTDCTSGFMAMRMSMLPRLNLRHIRTDGYGFLFGLKYRAHRARFRILEHPVRWPDRHQGNSKMNVGRVVESLLLPIKIRLGDALLADDLKLRKRNDKAATGS